MNQDPMEKVDLDQEFTDWIRNAQEDLQDLEACKVALLSLEEQAQTGAAEAMSNGIGVGPDSDTGLRLQSLVDHLLGQPTGRSAIPAPFSVGWDRVSYDLRLAHYRATFFTQLAANSFRLRQEAEAQMARQAALQGLPPDQQRMLEQIQRQG